MCGYMGLDSMGSSLMETQKLSFEEQPDAKVMPAAPWGPRSRRGWAFPGATPHPGMSHHPLPWDVVVLPSFLAIAPRSCSAALLWRVPKQLGRLPCLAKSPIFLCHHLFRSAAPWQASCQKLHSSLSPDSFSR